MTRPVVLRAIVFAVWCGAICARADAAGEYRTVEVEALKITFDSEWASQTSPGYLPVRLDIMNLGDPRVIEIVAQSQRWVMRMRGTPGSLNLRREVKLGTGDRVRLTIPIPVQAESENIFLELREGGRRLERFGYFNTSSGQPLDLVAALLVVNGTGPLNTVARDWPRPMKPASRSAMIGGGMVPMATGAPRTTPTIDFILDPSRLPTNWLGYTSVRAVVLGESECRVLDDEQRAALFTWLAAGGDLFLVDADLHVLFTGRDVPPVVNGSRADYFLGHVHMSRSADITEQGLDGVLAAAQPRDDSWPWSLPANRVSDWREFTPAGFRLAIPGVDRVPARAYVVILILFALVIGPLNWILLRRRGQQVLLVVTTPLISAAFLLLLGGYVVAGEGLSVRGRAVTFTFLDQSRKQAVSRATASFRAGGLLPSGGITLPRDAAVYALIDDAQGEQYQMDLTEAQRFSAGLLRSRSASNIEIITVRPARERVTVSAAGDRISVVNGLGVPVAQLVYRHHQQSFIIDAPLAPGQTATLKPGTYGGSVPPRLAGVFSHQPEGTYLAVVVHSPFWQPGVSRLRESDSFHAILGVPESTP